MENEGVKKLSQYIDYAQPSTLNLQLLFNADNADYHRLTMFFRVIRA